MSLTDLQQKLINDQAFTRQLALDADEVGVELKLFRDNDGEPAKDPQYDLDPELVMGNANLLNTYVNIVQKIIADPAAAGGAYRRLASYIHAPFDEPVFYIDTNTRLISEKIWDVAKKDYIPCNIFGKNGVGVVGDHLAELLFFRLPRFFDVVDLYKCDVYIYWHNTGLREYAEPHISEPIAKYSEGDMLNFGWYLTSDATEAAGQIEFAVEFVIRDAGTGEVTFRLATQPAKLIIKSAIDLDTEGVVAEDYETLIYSRSIYSNVVNSLTASPAVITKNLPTGDLNLDEETGTITLDVDAIIPSEESETNELVFDWNWNGVVVDQPSGNKINDAEHLIGVETYELENPKSIQFSDKVGNTYKTLETNVPGLYQVYIGNKVTSGENAGGIRYVQTHVAQIAPASAISLDNSKMPAVTYLDIWQDRNPELRVVVKDANGVVKYQWYHVTAANPNGEAIGAEGIAEPVLDARNEPTGEYQVVFDPSNNQSADIIDNADYRGYYYVKVRNIKNNTIQWAESLHTFIEVQPIAVMQEQIHVDRVTGNVYSVEITDPQHEAITYELSARVRYIVVRNGQDVPVESDVYFNSNNDVRKYFKGNNPVTDFEITDTVADKLGMKNGSQYTLFVGILPIAQYENKNLKRECVKTDPESGAQVPNRTYVTIENCTYYKAQG